MPDKQQKQPAKHVKSVTHQKHLFVVYMWDADKVTGMNTEQLINFDEEYITKLAASRGIGWVDKNHMIPSDKNTPETGSIFEPDWQKTRSLQQILEMIPDFKYDLALDSTPPNIQDDRQLLEQAGVEPDALLEKCRYFIIPAPGRLGMVNAEELDENTPIKLVTVKPGTPPSVCVNLPKLSMPRTNQTTVILGPGPDESHPWVLWTLHPGLPLKPATVDEQHLQTLQQLSELANTKNQTLTIKDYIAICGAGPVKIQAATHLHTIPKKPPVATQHQTW